MKTKDQKPQKENSQGIDFSETTLKKGLPGGWTRTTVVIREEFLEKIKAFAYWERSNMKCVLDEILEKFLSSQDIKPIPNEKKKFLK